MQNQLMKPQSRVWTVRADEPISQCVKLLREHGIGALIVLSDDKKEDVVGIFTERDLVRHLELIQRGAFWDTPVRTVMTSDIRTIKISELHLAPKLMAMHHFRHLPVVEESKGRKRLVGVLSMRDVFRYVMQAHDFDLTSVLAPPAPVKKHKKKLMGVFSADPAVLKLVDEGAKLTKHLLIKSAPLSTDFESLQELFERFDALFVDLDNLSPVELSRLLVVAKAVGRDDLLFIAFNPANLTEPVRKELIRIGGHKRVHLFSKPIALGLLYEKFLRDI